MNNAINTSCQYLDTHLTLVLHSWSSTLIYITCSIVIACNCLLNRVMNVFCDQDGLGREILLALYCGCCFAMRTQLTMIQSTDECLTPLDKLDDRPRDFNVLMKYCLIAG